MKKKLKQLVLHSLGIELTQVKNYKNNHLKTIRKKAWKSYGLILNT